MPFEADDDMDAWEQRRAQHLHLMRAYLPVMAPNGFFYGPSAAVLWEIPLPVYAWPDSRR